jgi:dTDP-4-amino-4,6-dideoxy-D-galactose acyltransferase
VNDTQAGVEARLKRLDWETGHFGLCAAQLVDPALDDDALDLALCVAREQGIRLLVWAAESERDVPKQILDQFSGRLVDRKATFRKLLQGAHDEDSLPRATDPAVIAYASATASAALVELAIISGAYSRFREDPRIPRERFEAMYRVWIERSVKKELADAVLIVPASDRRDDGHDYPLGMISLSESDGAASIGLVAVAPVAQGRGIGSTLMRAAHRWMRDRNAHESLVVTQLANAPACRLYERSGYHLARVQPYYHFWL